MEFDKTKIYRPYEKKAIQHVNKVSHEDKISWGFVYTECEEHHRYSGYVTGYKQAIADAQKVLQERGVKGVDMESILIYGI